MRANIAIVLCSVFALSSCEERVTDKWTTDQQLRAELFKECLKALPAGPISTKYNDWDEVVDSCETAAYWQSRYCYENCPPRRKEGE